MRSSAGNPWKAAPVRLAGTALAGVVGAVLLLGGCSSQTPSRPAHPRPTAASSGTSDPVPGPSPTAEPAPTAPAATNGAAGQRAFARYVMSLWGYTLRTNDAKVFAALGTAKGCGGCAALTRAADRRAREGWHVDFPGVQVRRMVLGGNRDVRVARATVDIPDSASYDTDGSFRNANPAHPGATFVVRMRYQHKHYRLVSFTVS